MSPTIQSPAPVFKVTALVDGAFKEVSLTDFHGQWWLFFTRFFLKITLTHYACFSGLGSQGDPHVLPSVRVSKLVLSRSRLTFLLFHPVTSPLCVPPKSSRSTTRSPNLRVSIPQCSVHDFLFSLNSFLSTDHPAHPCSYID